MRIKGLTVNAAGIMPAGADMREKKNQMQSEGGMFGPECRVTISREGRNLSGRQMAQPETGTQNAQSVSAERMLLREQKEAVRAKEIRDGYLEELNKIDSQIKYYNTYYAPMEPNKGLSHPMMKEVLEELKELQKAMQKQKQFQTEEAQRKAREAQQMAEQSAQYCQDEIDENNRDLTALLRTIEEAEKAEEGREESRAEDRDDASVARDSVSDVIRNSAAQFMTSSAGGERDVEERLARIDEAGHFFLDAVNTITQNVLRESAWLRDAVHDESFTDGQIEGMMQKFRDEMRLNYEDAKDYGSFGMEVLRKVREAKIQHIADDPLKGLQETKKSMMQSASDAALGEVRRGSLEESSKALADEVERLIDERNDIDKTPEEKKEEEEEREKMQEKLRHPEDLACKEEYSVL